MRNPTNLFSIKKGIISMFIKLISNLKNFKQFKNNPLVKRVEKWDEIVEALEK